MKLKDSILEGIRLGVEELANSVAEEAIERAPEDTGMLKQSITSQENMGGTIQNREGLPVAVPRIEPERIKDGWEMEVRSEADYSSDVEYGTGPHTIEPRTDRPRPRAALKFEGAGGKSVYRGRVEHPGTQAQPFMRPAMDYMSGRKGLEVVKREILANLKRRGHIGQKYVGEDGREYTIG